MTSVDRNTLARQYLGMLQEKKKTDIAWNYAGGHKGITVLNIEELHSRMKNSWRPMAKEGKLKIMMYNNLKKKTFDGKEWHILVVQSYKNGEVTNDVMGHPGCGWDPVGFCLMDDMFCVTGYIYAFQKKQNRDDVANWVMRGLDCGSVRDLCSICDGEYEGFGHNPYPVTAVGRCCDRCNGASVIPARIIQARRGEY